MTNEPSEDTPTPIDRSPGADAPTTEVAARQPTEVDLRPVAAGEADAAAPEREVDAEPAAGPLMARDTAEFTGLTAEEDADVAALRDVEFPLALRGYNTHAVDRYVAQVQGCIARFEQNRSPTEAVRHALDRVGEQTAAVLREAERSAEETTRQSRAKADDRLQRAEKEAAELWAAAQAKAASLDEDIERLWQERQRLIDATRRLAAQLGGAADHAEAEFPPEVAPAPPETAARPDDDLEPLSGPGPIDDTEPESGLR